MRHVDALPVGARPRWISRPGERADRGEVSPLRGDPLMAEDHREQLAGLAASLRAYIEWQEDTGATGFPRRRRQGGRSRPAPSGPCARAAPVPGARSRACPLRAASAPSPPTPSGAASREAMRPTATRDFPSSRTRWPHAGSAGSRRRGRIRPSRAATPTHRSASSEKRPGRTRTRKESRSWDAPGSCSIG